MSEQHDLHAGTTPDSATETIEGESSRGSAFRWLVGALVVVVVGAAVGGWMLLEATVPNEDLEATQAQLVATEADLAAARLKAAADLLAAEQRAAADLEAAEDRLSTAARREASLEATVGGLEGDVSVLERSMSGLRADLAERDGELEASQAEVTGLSEDLVAEMLRIEVAGAQIAAASGTLEEALAATRFIVAWCLWVDASAIDALESEDVDLGGHDEIIAAIGVAETWKKWANMDVREAAGRLDDLMDFVGGAGARTAFDAWFDCDGRRDCVETSIVLDAAIINRMREQVQAAADQLLAEPES